MQAPLLFRSTKLAGRAIMHSEVLCTHVIPHKALCDTQALIWNSLMNNGCPEAAHLRVHKTAEEMEIIKLYMLADRLGIDLRGIFPSIPHPIRDDRVTVLCVFGTADDMRRFQNAVASGNTGSTPQTKLQGRSY
jgi:hypothetical protein